MAQSKIEWTEFTWNPVTGCQKVSAGCKNCYAETMFNRLAEIQGNVYTGRKFTDVMTHPERLEQPLKLKKPKMIFVNSMSDLFHEDVPISFINEVWATMKRTEYIHTYQILTKRPARMEALLLKGNYVLKNVWLGVSVEDQQTADKRIPLLLQTPASVKWISAEPLLGELNISAYLEDSLNWVVVGCESGHKRRECKLEWIETIVGQCRLNKVPVFVKQLEINGRVVKDIEQFPEHLRIREYPIGV